MEHYNLTIMVKSNHKYDAENVMDVIATANKAIFQNGSQKIISLQLELYDDSSSAVIEKKDPHADDIDQYLADNSFIIRDYTVERRNYVLSGVCEPHFESDAASYVHNEGEKDIFAFYTIEGKKHKRVNVDIFSDMDSLRDINKQLKSSFEPEQLREKYTMSDNIKDTGKALGATVGSWFGAAKDFYDNNLKDWLK